MTDKNKDKLQKNIEKDAHKTGDYISFQETKLGGPYGVLDGEDLKRTKKRTNKNGGRGGI